MRRRLRAKYSRSGPKPTQIAWMSTAVILVAGLLWYLLHLFSTLSLGCEAVIAWWFEGGRFSPGLLYVSSLFVISLGLWLYVDIVRPKPVRIPVGIRGVQVLFVTAMFMMSVFQWGFFRPQSDEGRIYAYFQDEVVRWPVVRLFFVQADGIWAEPVRLAPDELGASHRREFLEPGIPRAYGRAGGRYNGQLECSARAEVDAAWERAYEAYFLARQAEEE